MALAVASTSFSLASDASSVSPSAPTGITEGDLLLIVAFRKSVVDDIVSSGFTKSFAYTKDVAGITDDSNITLLYKTATVSDESATNYTVSASSAVGFSVVMLRVSGWNIEFDPTFASADSGIVSIATSGGPFVGTMSTTFNRPYQQLHVIAASAQDTESFSGTINASDYTLLSSDANPTWTEVCDITDTYHTSGGEFAGMALAYSTSTDTSSATGYTVNYNEFGLANAATGYAVGFTVITPTDATGTNTLITTDTAMFTQAGIADGISSNILVEATGETFTQNGKAGKEGIWSNESQSSTTWSNEDKSS